MLRVIVLKDVMLSDMAPIRLYLAKKLVQFHLFYNKLERFYNEENITVNKILVKKYFKRKFLN